MKEGFIPPLEELAIPAAVRLPRLLVGEAAFDLFQRVGGTGAQVREPGLGLDLGQQSGEGQSAIGPVFPSQAISTLEEEVLTFAPQGRQSLGLGVVVVR